MPSFIGVLAVEPCLRGKVGLLRMEGVLWKYPLQLPLPGHWPEVSLDQFLDIFEA
jgi:hypothetical protein